MARRGLGRGLGALIPAEARGDPASLLREVPIGMLHPNPLQPRRRFDEATMASLAASIQELGVLQPVLAREGEGGSYELIAGERRWRAAKRAGLQTIPVLVQPRVDGARSLEHALVENLHREDLSPLEEAAAYQQLIDEFDMTHEQVAKRVGRSRAAVTNTVRLLQLPTGVQRALADGTISAGHARALLATPDRSLQVRLSDRIAEEGLSVRAVEELVRRGAVDPLTGAVSVDEAAGLDPSGTLAVGADGLPEGRERTRPVPGLLRARAGRALPEPGILELEELLAAHLDTRVKVEMHQHRGRLRIEFATLEDLERIYRIMVGGAGETGG